MKFRLLFLFTFLYFTIPLSAQQGNWRKTSKTADQLYANGNFEEAANYYLEAYKLKNSNTSFLYKAAECYNHLRYYDKAAIYYKELREDKDFPMAGFQYAVALKQGGNYEEAIAAFNASLSGYKGADSVNYSKIINTEIEGCELALAAQSENSALNVEHLSGNINTMRDEIAPLVFNDEILYFTSTMEGFSKIFRSQFKEGEWTKAIVPKFPEFKDMHVCHGTFTPDHQRFYFTLCEDTAFDVVKSKCDIYVTVMENGDWNKPRKLREYVKLEGTTATHPYVVYEGDTETLYFSSDRKGGKGGMDIWFMSRHIDSPEYDFTLPQNAGNNVNTAMDEITPYFDSERSVLYFSSNGHPSMGGFDVFKSAGRMNKFSKVQNMGSPVNSSADDYYYVENKSKSGGFISSNRLYGSDKITTDNDDIFFFSVPQKDFYAIGNIYEKSNNSIIKNPKVVLYEIKDSGNKRMLQSVIANNGTYQFSLIPERTFEIEVIKEGYEIASINFNTIAFDPDKEYGKPIYLEKEKLLSSVSEPVFDASNSTASADKKIIPATVKKNENSKTPVTTVKTPKKVNEKPKTEYVNATFEGFDVTTSAPKLDGVYYKIQISTAGFFNENDPIYDSLRKFGTFQTEHIAGKGWTRILLAHYFTLTESRHIMDRARANGFPEAFIVKYRNGKRIN